MENKEDKPSEEKNDNKNDDFGEQMMKCMRNMMGLSKRPTLPNFPINKKAQKKFLKDPFNKKHKNNLIDRSNKETIEKDKKEIVKKMVYPSGIIKTITKNEKNQIIDESVDYKDIKPNYINYLKENLDKELVKLIENSFLLYNRRPIISNIVKKPYSTKVLEEKILLWKYYIKNSTKEEKALLLRKLLYYIGRFSEKIFDEFMKIKEISQAHYIFKLKGKIDTEEDSRYSNANEFYMMTSFLGYNEDGKYIRGDEEPAYREEMKSVLLLQRKILNIKDELNGTGYGLVFLRELREIGEMYTNVSYIFESIFYKCYDIFDKKFSLLYDKIETFRVLWNFYVDYFIDNPFVMSFLIELKFIFGAYRQDDVVKYMHDLVLYRWNIHDILHSSK